ncbi:CHAD domain-containing protein [Solirubrobacter phytolaccae]|uniref:CHAD domain-containing protein n=1 Tax=Solirubrobacter phytolaccae TaxID=1404360 RepID=A0A9X3SAU8_9ACTN|nr:CHAD domain-containing protein [Solirubrobacter phytolaccae]MDA0180635.1 CHAD domain-containing protein [Solirubrobacter phytolaccae]
MSYTLSLDDPPEVAIERVRREQLEAAFDGLREELSTESIHDARKRLKKTRSLLRLSRPERFKRHNRKLRDAGRALSGARDADVMAETVEDLADRFSGRLPKVAFERVRAPLAARAAATEPEGSADTLGPLLSDAWVVRDVDLTASLKQTYARGRDAFKVADKQPTAEHLHEWRKRVKDLWYQQDLLEEVWPGVMKAQAKEAKKLSKTLGEDHDLAVLDELLRTDPSLDGDELRPLIARRRKQLLKQARKRGRRVYAERPKHFARRLRRYVELV